MSGITEDRKQVIQEQLDRIVSSTAFSGSERHRRFLRFLPAITAAVLSERWKRPAPPRTASILVLPFQTLAPASGRELLGDAIADAIITGLAGSPGLRVISRGSGIQFKESGRSPYQFAADLQVDYIVEGTVQADAVRARVSAKMTDVHSQSYVWAALAKPNWTRWRTWNRS